MYTFEFTYDESIDDFGSIQFCAETRTEAETLFKDWCEENGLKINEYDVKVVYDTYDAQEYGDDYMPCVDLGLMKKRREYCMVRRRYQYGADGYWN